ncbi:hypothetical protein ADK52_30955 [Streptomyces sp. WM6372]|uniref:DUF4258 domain-containing protein n=1 Tax=Streptomyces sp. WM6372 TaxID=1415555 RepID=UPI0006AEC4B1|nr:DUF4258 domain-containing protein [Streptomyces sp. WM6372]KOU18107.1 hypothetical protein ADK52_30955 [Streptomyces sp. WM6372]
MINSKRLRLALVALAASAATLAAVPAQAATSVPSQTRIQAAATAQVADLVDSPISPMRCRDDGQGCPELRSPCGVDQAPTTISIWSEHMLDRMTQRGITEEQVRAVVATGNGWCQVSQKTFLYQEPVGNRTLVVSMAWNKGEPKAVTAYWKPAN